MVRRPRCSGESRSWSGSGWSFRPSPHWPTACDATACRFRRGFSTWKSWRAPSPAWWRGGGGGGGQAMALIEGRNLTHVYLKGTPPEAVALPDVTLSVEAGEFVGIIGPTGVGEAPAIP